MFIYTYSYICVLENLSNIIVIRSYRIFHIYILCMILKNILDFYLCMFKFEKNAESLKNVESFIYFCVLYAIFYNKFFLCKFH